MLTAFTAPSNAHQTSNNEIKEKINYPISKYNLLSDYATNDDNLLMKECTLGMPKYYT